MMLKKINEKNKKAKLVLELIIFIILNLVFFVTMIYYVHSSGNKSFVYERIYAKKIGLSISSAKSGTIIGINVEDLIDFAKKNKFEGKIINISDDRNVVEISTSKGSKYSFNFFNNNGVEWGLDKENKYLSITIK